MTTATLLKGKADLIGSKELITQDVVCETLGITAGSAANLLTQWHREGLLHRLSAGIYLSAYAKTDLQKAQIRNIAERFGNDMVLIGASAWEKAGWCDGGPLHIAIPERPSRRMPKTDGVLLYPVGEKLYRKISENVFQNTSELQYLNPIMQMLWWMETDCEIPMPDPSNVFWEKFKTNEELRAAIESTWPEFEKLKLTDIEGVYEMLQMDQLMRREGMQDENEMDDNAESPASNY